MGIAIDRTKFRIEIEDLGVTLRTLLSCADNGCRSTGERTWGILYKGCVIGNVRVKDLRNDLRRSDTVARARQD